MESTEHLNFNSESKIRQFYAKKNILLTGCTGFLGTIALEKILRSCNEISKLYVLLRPKKGLSIEERLQKRLNNSVYDTLRKTYPNFAEKIVPIHGDLYKPCLGLSSEDRQHLVENLHIIIHNASIVSFKAKPSVILRVNVIGTLKMLELAAECPKLEIFAYVSTAFCHPHVQHVEEKFYPPPMDVDGIESIIRADEENEFGISEEALNDILGSYLNMYSFSKATAEGVIEKFGRTASFPCIVYRPSVVMMPYAEPSRSWMGSKNGPMLPVLMTFLGLMHAVYIDTIQVIDFIPVDMTINYLLAIIVDDVMHKKLTTPVYNYGSSDWHPIRVKDEYKMLQEEYFKYPTLKAVWYPFTIFTTNFYLFLLLHILFHIIPAAIFDFSLIIRGKPPMIRTTLFYITKYFNLVFPFTAVSWIIRVDKAKDLRNRMNVADLKVFNFDLGKISMDQMRENFLLSIRSMMKDTPDNLPAARRKYRMLKIVHYTVCYLLGFVLLYFLYKKFI